MTDNVRSCKFAAGLRQYPGNIKRDIAVADYHHMLAVQNRREMGEIGMAIVPTDKSSAAKYAGQIATLDF